MKNANLRVANPTEKLKVFAIILLCFKFLSVLMNYKQFIVIHSV